jgi:hypothetical protein
MRTLVHDLVASVHEACLEDRSARIREGDLELRATVLEILMHEIHDDVNRALRSLADGRGTPLTAS